MISCWACGKNSKFISKILPYCPECIREKYKTLKEEITQIHSKTRLDFGLVAAPPETKNGKKCALCVNHCRLGEGEKGFCNVRENVGGRIGSPEKDWAYLEYYHDPLPTNCVAAWVCPGCSKHGFPAYSYFPHPEYGYKNLAVFYEACTFNCLFCQNWSFKKRRVKTTIQELVDAADPLTSCICYFGGDPSPFSTHGLEVAQRIRDKNKRIFRICWETNGSLNPDLMKTWAEFALKSGGCIKIDFKAFSDQVQYALCGSSNVNTKENIRLLAELGHEREEPPLLVVSTLLVPGYIDEFEIESIARYISNISPKIPWSLLGFHPQFLMADLPCTSKVQAQRALEIAQRFGIEDVNIGNVHLLI